MRKVFKSDTGTKDGMRANEAIRNPRIQLIAADGQNMGEVETSEALRMAEGAGLDLVEISPAAVPPICKILDLGKLKYTNQKKAVEARKKQKVIEVKEVKVRPVISSHDYDIKMRAISGFLNSGYKVKVVLRFRGREITHQDIGHTLLVKIKDYVQEISKVELEPKLEGRQILMVLSPR
ncbi:translation initiation factor IF-3 [Candidatus Liberibacter sp.]|uniref:translation initiation factor IF-3 n=1 Tax=Candidatus Liberibacter sp. TaxID=34022 RepID=UPI0028702780|nr:translation initiation factor IF-3 [Candidatus Liberibacter sp.]